MTAAVQTMHSSASTTQQQEPSTAPVLEFACLFTRDLRRKQKRWQDGRLKYHTFNRRVMVYDERGNFVGDTHWREEYDLNEGDEVELERRGVVVQVAECTGSRDQDLSELIDKRAHERAERQAAALARRQPAPEAAMTPHATTPHFQLLHKPLRHLIGTPTGHHGRALIPTESPYEERQKLAVSPQIDSPRPAKRRKREVSPPSKGGYAQSLFGAALTLSGTPTSTPLTRNRPPRASSVAVESQPLVLPQPSHQSWNTDSTLVARCPTTTSLRKDPWIKAPMTTLLSKISQAPPTTLEQNAVEPQLPSSPVRNDTGSRAGSHVAEKDSANLNSWSPVRDKANPPRREESNLFRDTSSTVALGRNSVKGSSSDFRSKTTAQSQGPISGTKLEGRASSPHSTKDHRESAPGQPISEPRIELRIRPRKKPGLFMISESADGSNPSLLRGKSRKLSRSPITPLGDHLMGGSNHGVLDNNDFIDLEAGGTEHPQRKKGSTIDLWNSTASGAETGLSRDKLSLKSKSQNGRCAETKEERRARCKAGDGEDTLDIPNLAIHDESPQEIEPCAGRRKAGDGRTTAHASALDDATLVEPTSCPRSRKQPTRKKKRAPVEDSSNPSPTAEKYGEGQGESESSWPDDVPVPRLAQLGRKSIRSREVIGFIFDEEMDHCSGHPQMESGNRGSKSGLSSYSAANHSTLHPATSGANRMDITTTAKNDGQVGNNDRLHDCPPTREVAEADSPAKAIACHNVPASHIRTTSRLLEEQTRSVSARIDENTDVQAQAAEQTAATRQPPAKKVSNPATRGKKAAKPSDAAGQVPQCPLPPEAAVGKPLELGNLENNKRKSRQETRTKEATTPPMPGFARANGGPWSREAHDLFEFTRPP
ncbi:hypothetical protein F5Y05DRAFT_403017 [Hypoxylon sp. FL0543]|nr:hypothetical protein F5Y05DRAFT_403017 [Hypoxylon sp. FL0543]